MGGGVKLYSYLTKKREEIDGCKKEKGNTVVSLFIDEFYFHLFEDVEYPSLHSAEDQSFTLHPFAFLSFHVHQCALEFILHDSLVSLPLFSPSFSILPFPSLPSSFSYPLFEPPILCSPPPPSPPSFVCPSLSFTILLSLSSRILLSHSSPLFSILFPLPSPLSHLPLFTFIASPLYIF